MKKGKAQVSMEHLLLVGFVTFVLVSLLGIAYLYSSQIKDQIRVNQVDKIGKKIRDNVENVYYMGEPSKTTIRAYMPEGVRSITVYSNEIIFIVATSSGDSMLSYRSEVTMDGNISHLYGFKEIEVKAEEGYVQLSG